MNTKITLNKTAIDRLDMSILATEMEKLLTQGGDKKKEQQLQFAIDYQQAADEPRELSEVPEIRLWFVRADALYPWLPLILDWKSGELVRYTAMLVPHQFSRSEGIIFNPEALEIYVMHKIFVLAQWSKKYNLAIGSSLSYFSQLFGYEITADFLEQL